MDSLSPTAHERRHQRVLLRWDVIDHLPVGEEWNIGVELERLWRAIRVTSTAVEHGVGHRPRVMAVPVELVVQVIDAVLLLITGHTLAAYKQSAGAHRTS